MSKFSVKTLLIIFLSLLIAIVVLWKFVLPKQKVKAAWWNDSWHYRKIINVVNNTNFDATNIPYKISLDTTSLITAGKLQADADDIRIIDQNGNLIRSQIEKKTLNTNASVIWFEVTVKSKNSSSYYIYYGNSTATAPVFESDINTFTSNSTSTTIEMKDGFGYTTSSSNGGRISDIRKNSTNLGVDGNVPYSSSYPSNWWSGTGSVQTIQNSTGPLFAEVTYGAGATGSYSSYGTNIKIFDNGFAETQFFVTYSTSGSENFYYYLSFDSGTRNSVWVDGSGNLVDQSANSGNLYETNLGQNWFGQRWTSTGNYGGNIITKNGSDWQYGYTSAQASYFQTNYSYSRSFTNGSSREVRFGVFAGNGGLSEMQQKGANYGALSSSSLAEEAGGGPVAYWKFDEGVGTTVFDSSNNSNTGIITNATWQTEDNCINGKCLDFNGINNSINAGNANNLNLTNAITLEAWVKITYSSNINSDYFPVQKTGNYWFWNGWGSLAMNFEVWVDGARRNPGAYILSPNVWYHLTGVYDSSTRKLQFYINGKNVKEITLSGLSKYTMDTTTNSLVMGYSALSKSSLIDEVKIYPYARTADQIKQDYNSRGTLSGSSTNLGVQSNTSPSLKSSLVAYYKFDEGSGSIAYDSSPQKANATISYGNWNNNGKSNKAISIGSTSAIITSNVIYNNSQTFTLSSYIYPTSTGSFVAIIGTSLGNNLDSGLTLSNNNICYHDYSTMPGDFNLCSTTNPIVLNKWQHVVLTYNNGLINLFVNGIKVKTGNFTKTNTNRSLVIGRGTNSYAPTQDRSFYGSIDEVKIYNRALTDEEIKQDYNSGSAISFGSTTQNIGGTTTSLDYCIPGDTSYCASPVAEWNFEENTGTVAKDTSGNNLNGTFGTGNSAPSWSLGANNKGASTNFDGNDFINIGDTLSGNNLSNLFSATYSFWIYPKSLTSNASSGQRLIEKRDSSIGSEITTSGYIYTGFWYSTGYDFWSSAKKLGYYDSGIDEWTTSNLNKWYYISIVFDSPNNTGKTYINGILDKEYTLVNNNGRATGVNNSTLATQLGRYRWNENNFFQGKMDNVRIYNYARTPAQIAYDYNKGAPVAWWKLDECQGNVAHDSSPIGNNGSINIGTSGTQTSAGTCNTSGTAWGNGASGHINSSLNFDGVDDYVTFNSANIINPSQGSVSFWFKPSSTQNGNGYYMFAHPGSSTNSRIYIYSSASGTSVKGLLGDGTQIGIVNVTANNWHHVTLIWNGTSAKFYVDGLDKTSKSTFNGLTTAVSNSSIGSFSGGSQGYTGQIDDVRIYNYALTPEQIKQVYNNGTINFN